MFQAERRRCLTRAISERGTLSIRRAMELTGASEPTIRRDFALMAGDGVVQRTWGGVSLPADGDVAHFSFREVRFSEEKAALARKAAGLLREGEVVFIDGGTTTFHLSSCLADIPLQIITNSLRLAEALQARRGRKARQDVHLTGGLMHAGGGLLVGAGVADSLRRFHADWAFIGAGGVTDSGIYSASELMAQAEREMIANADRVVLLVDHSKIGKYAMCRIGDVAEIDIIVSDADPLRSAVLPLIAKRGVQIISA